MTDETEKPASTRDEHGRWRKGYTPNPKGRPAGSRHKTTLAIEAMLEGEAEALTRKAIDMAMNGDVVALRLCLERAAPLRKGRPVVVDLPPIDTAKDVVGAVGAIVGAVGEGALTPEEGQTVASILDAHRKAIETQELETRLTIVEAALKEKQP
jgi:hypothetical protein